MASEYGFLVTEQTPPRGRRLIRTLQDAAKSAGLSVVGMNRLEPCKTLVAYGVGAPATLKAAREHAAKGGRLMLWDAGYWERTLGLDERKYRVSLDYVHPQAYVMLGPRPNAERLKQSRIEARDERRKSGCILLVGSSPKSVRAWGGGWSAAQVKTLRSMFPGEQIVYRPKPKRPPENGVKCDDMARGKIEVELSRARLVVCKHSNVAVDACRYGVPAVCEDGAAAAIYPRLSEYKNQPDKNTRQEFLERLAYWQWSQDEIRAGAFWKWYESLLPSLPPCRPRQFP